MNTDLTRETIDEMANSIALPPVDNGRVSLPTAVATRLFNVAEAHLDEPARLAAARAEGVREGWEKAAEWCRVQAYCAHNRERAATDEAARRAELLVKQTLAHAADCFLQIAPSPAEAPTTPTVEEGDGWIEWKGGECPVQDGVETHARMRDGVIGRSLEPRGWCGWQHDPKAPALDILAYRIVQPAEASAPVAEGGAGLEQRVAALEAEVAALREALKFYADPDNYIAISFLSDPPCGEFMNDFDEDHGNPFVDRPMPGKRARALLQGQEPTP